MRVPLYKCDKCDTRVLAWMPEKGMEGGRLATIEELLEVGWWLKDGETLCAEHKPADAPRTPWG